MSCLSVCGAVLAMAVSQVGAPPATEALSETARKALAQLEGEIRLPGLAEPVEVLRDRWGVPHIYARNQHDLFFAQGFVAAQDRLFQLDLWRRIAVGETAAVMGPAGLERDRFARLLRYRGDMQAEWGSYSPDTREIATAFTDGINACIDHLGQRLPVEFGILGVKPARWRPEDVLGRMSGITMVRNFTNEVKRAALVAAIGAERARRIAPTDPVTEYGPVAGFDLAGIDKSVLRRLEAATAGLSFDPGQGGSNNWVVDATLSASGSPMLANDPHRPILLPSLRYLVHLHAPGWNVIGAGEPALPGVAVGHNEQVAWGITVVNTDQCDLYVEETNPADPTEYRADGRWRKMEIVREPVSVKGAKEANVVELRYTRHGPVIHEDEKLHRAYALRWAGAEPGGAAYLGSLALDRATDWNGFRQAIRAWKVPSENVVYADRQKNIGWVATALTPIRNGWNGLLPVPGAEGRYEWKGFLDVDQYPQEFNPGRHYVVTANSNILPRGYTREIAYEWTQPFRFERLRQRIEAQKRFTPADFRSMQYDVVSLPGQALARLAGLTAIDDPALAREAARIAGWNGTLTRGSTEGPLYSVWLAELLTEFYRPHVPAESLEFVVDQRGAELVLPALEKLDPAWLGENARARRDELLRVSLTAALKKLALPAGGASGTLDWGHYRGMTFRHPLEKLGSPYAELFNLGPVPRIGDKYTPNPTSVSTTGVVSGASYREIFDLSDWDLALATNTPGQSGQPGSPHYADLLPLWNDGDYFPLKFSRPAVEEVTRHRLTLRP